MTGWLFQIFFIFTPFFGGRCPIRRAYFSDGAVQPPARMTPGRRTYAEDLTEDGRLGAP